MSGEKKETIKYANLACHHFVTYLLPPLLLLHFLVLLSPHIPTFSINEARKQWDMTRYDDIYLPRFFFSAALFSVTLILVLLRRRPRPVYMIDFSCYKPDDTFKHTCEAFVERSIVLGTFTEENVLFQKKILERSGLGGSTYFPKAVATLPPDLRMVQARKEAELVIFGAVEDLLKRTDVAAGDIGIVVVNCSLFCPTPSLAEMLIHRYRLREDVVCYHLSGMGCSAGLISLDLARQLLQVCKLTVTCIGLL